MIPKLIFKYAYPLDRNRRELFKERNFGEYPAPEVIKNRIQEWRKVWEEINIDDRIIKQLIELTGVELGRDFELYVFGAGLNAMSKPLMMPVMRNGNLLTDSQFLETIIHELCHRFAGDQEETPRLKAYWEMVSRKYNEEHIVTQNHIIVYALLSVIFKNIFSAKQENINPPKDENYLRAVSIVKEVGAENIIKEFRDFSK